MFDKMLKVIDNIIDIKSIISKSAKKVPREIWKEPKKVRK